MQTRGMSLTVTPTMVPLLMATTLMRMLAITDTALLMARATTITAITARSNRMRARWS